MAKQKDPIFEGERDPRAWLDLARRWHLEGRFAEALRAHEFYHDNADRVPGSGQSGVRLSFALSDWVNLGDHHPPALRALRRRRSRAAAKAVGSPPDREAFYEALSIDHALDDVAATLTLIDAVETAHPQALDDMSNHMVQEALLARGEYKRCLRWVGEPAELFNHAAGFFMFGGGFSGQGLDPPFARKQFLRAMAELTELLVGAGRTRLARRYLTLAQRLYDHPSLENAVDDARVAVRARRRR